MRIVFMGTPSFALPSLRACAQHHEVVAVYTRPDAASGRGRTLRPTPVKVAAQELGIPVEQPRTLRDEEVQLRLRAYEPDAIVVAAYGMILPPEVLEIPRFGCINVHGSLLPRWRGAAPVQRAILAGDELAGVAIMRMEEGLDTGPYCETATVRVADKSADELAEAIAEAGALALVKALDRIAAGTCEWTTQDESAVTYAEKIAKDDVALSPELPVSEALRRVRASGDTAPARAVIGGIGVRIVHAAAGAEHVEPGTVAAEGGVLRLGFADGALEVDRIKPEGKAEMLACDWLRGARLGSATWEATR